MKADIELALQASICGVIAASRLPNYRSLYMAPLHPNCTQQHYGLAFFYAGSQDEIERIRDLIQGEIGLTEVTESSLPIYEAIMARPGRERNE